MKHSSPREQAYARAKVRLPALPRAQFDSSFERKKSWLLKFLNSREVPMDLRGISLLAPRPAPDLPPPDFTFILRELVQEGVLYCDQKPDGHDQYGVTGRKYKRQRANEILP